MRTEVSLNIQRTSKVSLHACMKGGEKSTLSEGSGAIFCELGPTRALALTNKAFHERDNVMTCACATFRSKLEKFRRNFSSLNSINSKWRRLVDPVVVCQQGEFDCNE